MAFSDETKVLAVAACERYGAAPATRLLEAVPGPDEHVPCKQTLLNWRAEGVKIPEEGRDFWTTFDAERRQRRAARSESRMDPLFDALDDAIEGKDGTRPSRRG